MVNPAQQRPRFLAPGDKLGKYDLIRQIAVGGMAELYLARTLGIEGFEKLVVLKRILPRYLDNQAFVNMFLNEARLAAQLQHPNIAQVYDIGVEAGDYFFAMEYVHGEDLGHLNASALENGVPMSLDAALALTTGLCAGLHHAHDKHGADGQPLGIVHRDVSPSNVLVSYDGAVKLVDFGIARAQSHDTTQGGLEGKIAYMSPEQGRGKVLDRRSDVFSVGTILYELTTGQMPFTDETELGILERIVTTDAPRPSTIVPGYPPALEAIVMRALAREVDQRYTTALALQTDLDDFAHESHLRISPLVLARLMSTLFPARLEEWERAKKQGAFFVEQHVVQTLIEAGGDHDATGVDTQVTAPISDSTNTHVKRVATPAFIVDTGSAGIAAPPPPAPRVPTPHPGAVPILAAFSMPIPGTLVAPDLDAPAMIHDPGRGGDRTERVVVPVRQRSRAPVIAVAAAAVLAVGVVVMIVTHGGDSPAAVVQPIVAQPKVEAPPPPPEPTPAPPAPIVVEPPPPPPASVAVVPPAPKLKKPKTPPPKIAKPAPPKEGKWNADSPFMPVRTDKR